MKKYAIFSSVGDQSAHPQWIKGDANFDIFLCYYGDDVNHYKNDTKWYYENKGSKFMNFVYLYNNNTHFKDQISTYDYVALFDDDILIDTNTINKFFNISKLLDAWVSQPAYLKGSRVCHNATHHKEGSFARITNFVEIGFMTLKKEILSKVMPDLTKNFIGYGWGVDYYMYNYLGCPKDKFYIIDETPGLHPHRTSNYLSEMDTSVSRNIQQQQGEEFLKNTNTQPYNSKTLKTIAMKLM